jgi:hypothetical protein
MGHRARGRDTSTQCDTGTDPIYEQAGIVMDRAQRQVKLGFTDERFPVGTHMCLIYDNEGERRTVIGKYLEAGLREGEKVSYFTDTTTPAEVMAWLTEAGIDTSDYLKANRFSVAVAEEAYCPHGRFVPEEMLDMLRTFHGAAFAEGCAGGRLSGEMSWALKGIPGSDRLIEYEALLNYVFATHPLTGLCQYDARRFSGGLIFDVLQVHPMMIVHGQVTRNPYYVRPEEFLESRR